MSLTMVGKMSSPFSSRIAVFPPTIGLPRASAERRNAGSETLSPASRS
jgi:hypothetical protein